MGAGTLKKWDEDLAKATSLVTPVNQAVPVQSEFLCSVEGNKVPMVHVRNMLGKTV